MAGSSAKNERRDNAIDDLSYGWMDEVFLESVS